MNPEQCSWVNLEDEMMTNDGERWLGRKENAMGEHEGRKEKQERERPQLRWEDCVKRHGRKGRRKTRRGCQ